MRRALAAAAVAACALLGPVAGALAQEAWVIERFHTEVAVRPDASITVVESIDVDFGSLERHGIFRDIPVRYEYDERQDRLYELRVRSVTDAAGRSWRYERISQGADIRIRIGDPDRTITGRQTYRITYEVAGALNAFGGHDELFWNSSGEWGVPMRQVTARVRLDRGAVERAACFEGYEGSTDPCRSSADGAIATFAATRSLEPGEQLTIVAAFPKGAVAEPAPILVRARREPEDFFELNALTVGAAAGVLVLGIGAVLARWMSAGRDRRYLKRYYLDPAAGEGQTGPFDRDVIVTEYEPPELLGPAEVGLLLDETADTKDLTATIVHLAVRGHLAIEEIPGTGLFARKDWTLRRRWGPDEKLAPYERRILDGLFEGSDAVKLSDLKGTFHSTLAEGQRDLYRDAVKRSWFPADPYWTRIRWQIGGCAVALVGIFLAIVLGIVAGAAVVGLAVLVVGAFLVVMSGAMPSRTAHGRELLLRILGFRRYMETAETERQRFAERENIFAAYLPYAIVFGSVTKWARAFEGIDAARATAGWYTGAGVTDIGAFSNDLSSMSGAVSSAISSTPSSSGSSGFSGGSSGGGGGGGGGGSW